MRIAIVSMRVVEINAIRLKASKALLALLLDLPGAQTAGTPRIVKGEFRSNVNTVAIPTRFDPFADRRFAFAASAARKPTRIKIGRIQKRSSAFGEIVQKLEARFSVDLGSKQIGAKNKSAHVNAGFA
jgi:hypothetical protein